LFVFFCSQLLGSGRDMTQPKLTALEALRIAPLPEAAQLAGVSVMTLKRRFRPHIIQISKRKQGIRVYDALLIGAEERVKPFKEP
jgi:hypothetical protein